MKKIYATFLTLFLMQLLSAQEEFVFSNYDGAGITLTAATATVNDEIIITFMDTNIIDNFYTEGRTQIYLYGGLDTSAGGFQGAPDFGTLSSQPVLTLISSDTDANMAPNTYTITINLATVYSSVPDGTTVFGFNLLFQNEFGGGGNNQTVDLYINLVDAAKDSTLDVTSFDSLPTLVATKGGIKVKSLYGEYKLKVYDVLGKKTYQTMGSITNENFFIPIKFSKNQINLVRFESPGLSKTIKIISH